MPQVHISVVRAFVALALGVLTALPSRISVAETPKPPSADEIVRLKEVFPKAAAFSAKGGALPHYKAYTAQSKTGADELVGFVFMTHEVEPDEYGYASQIEILVGLTTGGVITGVKVIDHREPFGSFSIDPPEFATQFKGKSILDAFDVGEDIDAVTRATITIDGAARVIRKSARRILKQHLAETQGKK
jgi:NosR/NirI family transcriptional regulator, nitrous oxide reductase regulator